MTRRRIGEYLVGVASGLVFLSAFAHGILGWSALEMALQGRVEPDVIGATGIGWHFGSLAMATFGVLGLISFLQMRRGWTAAHWTPVVVGGAYTLFGTAAFLFRGLRPHFVFFILLGLMLLVGAFLWSPEVRE